MSSIFKKLPFFILFLPFFFVLHGYRENYDFISSKDALLLFLKYIGVCFLLALPFGMMYKNMIKASLVVFLIMAYNFFFGNTHDFLKTIIGNTFLVKYTFIIPASLICLIIIIVYLKKSASHFTKITQYLNWLFLILIFFDAGSLVVKAIQTKPAAPPDLSAFTNCDTCSRPDIYLIVADEYANTQQLKESFNFDNSTFETDLKKRGFHVVQNSKSNYNSTPFSIASLLTMNYIDSLGNEFNDKLLNSAYNQINENILTSWLHHQKYEIKNYSVFRFGNIPNPVNSTFFITGTDLFTLHTFIGRFNRDVRFNFITRFKIKSEIKKFVQDKLNNNEALINKTIAEANSKSNNPRFVYLHTMMPHFPYLMDKNGIPDYSASFLESNRFNQAGYLGYLQYSNKIFLQLIDKIQSASPNSIIIFMGDHGFRHLEGNNDWHFMSFNSIYLPDKKYSPFYDGMSVVNEFRILLNTEFNQHMPILKDSTIFLTNWW